MRAHTALESTESKRGHSVVWIALTSCLEGHHVPEDLQKLPALQPLPGDWPAVVLW